MEQGAKDGAPGPRKVTFLPPLELHGRTVKKKTEETIARHGAQHSLKSKGGLPL